MIFSRIPSVYGSRLEFDKGKIPVKFGNTQRRKIPYSFTALAANHLYRPNFQCHFTVRSFLSELKIIVAKYK
jgi:hypothetical protein